MRLDYPPQPQCLINEITSSRKTDLILVCDEHPPAYREDKYRVLIPLDSTFLRLLCLIRMVFI